MAFTNFLKLTLHVCIKSERKSTNNVIRTQWPMRNKLAASVCVKATDEIISYNNQKLDS